MSSIQVLGPARVDGNGNLSPRERTVLAALVLLLGRPVSPDQLADAVWGDSLPATWNKQVQSAVGRVRRALGPAAIETTPAGYRLVVEPRSVDVTQFESEVGRARTFAATGEPARAAVVFDRALNLWDGPAYADLASWEPGFSQAQRLEDVRRTVQEDLLEARLAFGDNRGVAADAESAVRAEPLRERRWAVLALAQYRDGRQADALATLRRARRTLADELGIDPGAALVELERQVLRQDPRAAGLGQHPDARATCPWKGLAAYDAADQEDFFGREDEVTACLARLDAMPVLVLTGESGCGKSSLLRAGLVAALRDAGRQVVVAVPGPSPVGGLQAVLAGIGAHDVLAVDQLESLFLLEDREQVLLYCGLLRRHVQDGGSLLLAVRADKMGGLAVDPTLGALAERGLHLVSPLAGDDLRHAIEEPARVCGLTLEHGLVDLLLRDVEADPGALPLLSHALVETWSRREGNVLTVESYRGSGGISAAVARSADRLYEGLPEDQRALCRSVLLRLVAQSTDGPPVPRRVPASSMRGDAAREQVVADLVGARLLTAREDSIEMAHESLARAWPRLRSWIDDDAVGTRLLRHLVATTEAWEALGRPDSDLYRGGRLDAALEWRDTAAPDLTSAEEGFLAASVALRSSALDAERARAAGERRQNRRLRVALAATAVVLVVALVAAGAASSLGRRARTAQQTAEIEAVTSGSQAAQDTNRAVAALLAVEAYRRWPQDPRTRSALLGVFTASPGFDGYVRVPGATIGVSGALLGDGRHAVVAVDDGRLAVVDLETGALDEWFPDDHVPEMRDSQVVVSADGTTVAHLTFAPSPQGDCVAATQDDPMDRTEPFDAAGSAAVCATVATYDVATGAPLAPRTIVPALTGSIALSPDGATLAVLRRRDGAVLLLDARDGHELGSLPGSREPLPIMQFQDIDSGAVAFDAAGRLYVGAHDGPVRVLAPRTTTVARTLPVPAGAASVFLAVGDDELVAVGARTATAVALDDGLVRWTAPLPPGLTALSCPTAAVSWTQQRLLCGDYDGVVTEHDLTTGEPTGVERDTQIGHFGPITVSSDGSTLATFGQARPEITRWSLDGTGPVTRLVAAGQAPVGGFGPDASTLLVGRTPDEPGAEPATHAVWDVRGDRVAATPERPVTQLLWGSRATPVALIDGGVYRLELPSGRLARLASVTGRADTVAAAGDDRIAVYKSSRSTITLADPEADTVVGQPIRTTSDYVFGMSASPDGSLLATEQVGDTGLFADSHTRFYDLATGAIRRQSLTGWWWTVAGNDGLIVSSKGPDLSVLRPDTLTPIRELASMPGEIKALELSDDGHTLAATSTNQLASLYDPMTGIRLGNLIDLPVQFDTRAYLSHDGTTLAVAGRDGVLLWNLDPADLAAAACSVAGRNLTASEWATYLPSLGSARETCPT